jgi:hypothetical protein
MKSTSKCINFEFSRFQILLSYFIKKRKQESPKKAQHGKIENVAGSVWLSLFMDGTAKCKLPSTPPKTGLSRIQHLTCNWYNFEFWNIRRCVHMTVIMEPSMWHVSAIPWKAAYGPCNDIELFYIHMTFNLNTHFCKFPPTTLCL